jgi:hypothetical protein
MSIDFIRRMTIVELNDALRRSFAGGQFFLTAGIRALPMDMQHAILARVCYFEEFDADNDPHGEHDFGSFDHGGQKIFWKIDYYDRNLEFRSPDPADSTLTTRVLTIMVAEEY